MQTVRAVIFDLDGTLLNTLDDLCASVNAALCAYGMPPRTLAEVRCFVGNGIANLVRRAVPEGTSDALVQQVLAAFRAHYAEHNLDTTAPYDGVAELLTALHNVGIPMAIVSNKIESAVEMLRRHFFSDTVALAVGDVPDRPRKPAPDGTLAALAQLGVSPDEAIFVGDSEVDMITARAAGMRSLAVTWGFRTADTLRAQQPTYIVDTPASAARLLLALTAR